MGLNFALIITSCVSLGKILNPHKPTTLGVFPSHRTHFPCTKSEANRFLLYKVGKILVSFS